MIFDNIHRGTLQHPPGWLVLVPALDEVCLERRVGLLAAVPVHLRRRGAAHRRARQVEHAPLRRRRVGGRADLGRGGLQQN